MAIKVLLLNFPEEEILKVPRNMAITQATIEDNLTLHDFHAIIIDAAEIIQKEWWRITPDGYIISGIYNAHTISRFKYRVGEQIETGGITLCFSHKKFETYFVSENYTICNYFFCPIDLGVVNESGNTFYPRFEELRYFSPLMKQIPLEQVEWSCYFSKVPENARILGVNRAGYSVFMEVPLGSGKLVMLPRFKDRAEAVTIIVNEIIPQMIHEEEVTFIPQWLPDFSSPFEKQIKNSLGEIEKAKRLVFTKDKLLKKAVAFAFEKLGFKVDILPDGTLPDLRIAVEEQKAIVEVKGHENKQVKRNEVLQLLGYLSETDIEEKGIVVSNHEFNKEPDERGQKAFTAGAIQLGEKMNTSLISSVDLYNVVMKILEKKMDSATTTKIRDKIMASSGLVQLS